MWELVMANALTIRNRRSAINEYKGRVRRLYRTRRLLSEVRSESCNRKCSAIALPEF